jgi:ATP-dependent RNA helicase DeaD
VGRSGRAITFIEPRQQQYLNSIERHTKTKVSPWIEGAHVAPSQVNESPRRHQKPHDEEKKVTDHDEHVRVVANIGRSAGIHESDLIRVLTKEAAVDGESIRNVRLLEKFTLFEVPKKKLRSILKSVDGVEVEGVLLQLEEL